MRFAFVSIPGKVSLEVFVPGKGPPVIETIGEGHVLGCSSCFPPYRWQRDARALEVTRAISLDAARIRAKCAEDHDFGHDFIMRFARVLVERLEAASNLHQRRPGTP